MAQLPFNTLQGLAGAIQILTLDQPQMRRVFNEKAKPQDHEADRRLKRQEIKSYTASILAPSARARVQHHRRWAHLLILRGEFMATAVLRESPEMEPLIAAYFRNRKDRENCAAILDRLKAPTLAAIARKAA